MLRQVAFLMRASKGGLSHSEIMSLTWRQFQVYLDSFLWLLNEETEDGKRKNRKWDLQALASDPRAKERKESMVEETRRIVAKHKEFALKRGKPGAGAVKRSLLE